MKPVAFGYHAPTTIDAAVALLAQHADDARLLAGGQTLLPMMNFRLVAPAVIIDLNRIAELAYIKSEAGVVQIGAMTRQRTIEFSPIVAEQLPLLQKAIQMVGHLPTRSRGTIGGSIANADSAAELPMILQVLEGEVEVRGAQGARTIAAADLFCDAMTTSIADDELLTEVRFPAMASGTRHAIEEFSRRRGDFAIGAVAVTIVENGGVCTKARIATAGISAVATRFMEAEQCLEGRVVDEATIAEAAKTAAHLVKPVEDRNASRAFRRHLTKTLTGRALLSALS
jgi:carbon-monoxide dehydrogenase medium subunit